MAFPPDPPDLMFTGGFKRSSRWSLDDVFVYPKTVPGACEGCYQRGSRRAVEMSWHTAQEPTVEHWAVRHLCPQCLLIARSAATGKITYCAY